MENVKIIDLVKKVAEERNEIAFSEIFDFIAPKINAYYIKNNLSIEQAEELTQEVLSTIWLKAEQFDPEKSKFITWLCVWIIILILIAKINIIIVYLIILSRIR